LVVEGSPDAEEEKFQISAYFGHLSAILAVGIFLWQATLDGGWLRATFGGPSTFFWLLIGIWLTLSIMAMRRRQHWWVIFTAPFAIYPVFMAALLFAACTQGNCI
jgi:hypothetical protein